MAEKYLLKSGIFSNFSGCHTFSKISLYFKKTNSARNIFQTHSEICSKSFFYDEIDLNQSVKGTLKVLRKSLKTVLEEVHFIVNLFSFHLLPVHQANLSLPKVSYLPSYRHNNLQNSRWCRKIVNSLSVYLFLGSEL